MIRSVSLRPATWQDIDDLYRWRNDPQIHRWFREQDGELDWHDHVSWLQNRPESRSDLIIEYTGTAVGVISIAADADVGIYIGEQHLWGRGIASKALGKALESRSEELQAEIHIDNTASRRLFESHGFEETDREDDWIQYTRAPDTG